jgi:hypothetical protein
MPRNQKQDNIKQQKFKTSLAQNVDFSYSILTRLVFIIRIVKSNNLTPAYSSLRAIKAFLMTNIACCFLIDTTHSELNKLPLLFYFKFH